MWVMFKNLFEYFKKLLNIFFKIKYFLYFFMIIKIKRCFGINVKVIRYVEWV